MRQKALRGWYPCSLLPTGYIHNPERFSDVTAPEIIPDIERFKTIRKGWDLVLSGSHSVKSVYKILCNEYGLRNQSGKKYAESTVYGFFKNKFYCGYFDWTDTTGTTAEIKGKHKPMITDDEYAKVQQMFGKRGRPRQYEEDINFSFRGPLTCGDCGCKITAERKQRCICENCKRKFSIKNRTDCPDCSKDISNMTNPSILDKTYYHCTGRREGCKQKGGVNEQELDKQISLFLSSITIPIEFQTWLQEGFTIINEEESSTKQQVIKNEEKREKVLSKQFDNYALMRANEEISKEEFLKYRTEIEKELKSLSLQEDSKEERSKDWFTIAENYTLFAKNASLRFKNGTKKQKKSILVALGSNPQIKEKKLYISLPKALSDIKMCHDDFFNGKEGLEPIKSLILKGENTPFEVSSSVLLAGLRRVRTYILS